MKELIWLRTDPKVWHYGKLKFSGIMEGTGLGTIAYDSVEKYYSCTFLGGEKPEIKYNLEDAIRFVEEEIQKRG